MQMDDFGLSSIQKGGHMKNFSICLFGFGIFAIGCENKPAAKPAPAMAPPGAAAHMAPAAAEATADAAPAKEGDAAPEKKE